MQKRFNSFSWKLVTETSGTVQSKSNGFLIRMDIIYCMFNEEFVMREHMFYNVL
ncbi:UNVERIFIED_ORG: hypothetical protein QFZ59_003089 [Bacillus sp. B2I3]|jgi:hypothetical protein|nr:hypothetical protein [Bacillus sp. B2I3]